MYGSPRELTVLNKYDYLDKGKVGRHNMMEVFWYISDSALLNIFELYPYVGELQYCLYILMFFSYHVSMYIYSLS